MIVSKLFTVREKLWFKDIFLIPILLSFRYFYWITQRIFYFCFLFKWRYFLILCFFGCYILEVFGERVKFFQFCSKSLEQLLKKNNDCKSKLKYVSSKKEKKIDWYITQNFFLNPNVYFNKVKLYFRKYIQLCWLC